MVKLKTKNIVIKDWKQITNRKEEISWEHKKLTRVLNVFESVNGKWSVTLVKGLNSIQIEKKNLSFIKARNIAQRLMSNKKILDYKESVNFLNEIHGYIEVENDEDYSEKEIIELANSKILD